MEPIIDSYRLFNDFKSSGFEFKQQRTKQVIIKKSKNRHYVIRYANLEQLGNHLQQYKKDLAEMLNQRENARAANMAIGTYNPSDFALNNEFIVKRTSYMNAKDVSLATMIDVITKYFTSIYTNSMYILNQYNTQNRAELKLI